MGKIKTLAIDLRAGKILPAEIPYLIENIGIAKKEFEKLSDVDKTALVTAGFHIGVTRSASNQIAFQEAILKSKTWIDTARLSAEILNERFSASPITAINEVVDLITKQHGFSKWKLDIYVHDYEKQNEKQKQLDEKQKQLKNEDEKQEQSKNEDK